MAAKPTPAALARERALAAVTGPPTPPKAAGRAELNGLQMMVRGQPYLIGPSIEGDPLHDATKSTAETWTMTIRDRAGGLARALSDQDMLLQGAARITIDGIVYVLQSCDADDTGLVTCIWEDEVAWRLRQFTSAISADRAQSTRAEFIAMMVDEAARPPMAPMNFFCPQILDKQRIAAAARGTASTTTSTPTADTGQGKAWLVPCSFESDPPGTTSACGHIGSGPGFSILSASGHSSDAATAGQAIDPYQPCGTKLLFKNPSGGQACVAPLFDRGAGSDAILPVVGLYADLCDALGMPHDNGHVIIQAIGGASITPRRGTPV
jgi:hypothetical protein